MTNLRKNELIVIRTPHYADSINCVLSVLVLLHNVFGCCLVDWDCFSANVPRQVSLAGAAGGSNEMGAKALGLLFCQQALCLSGGM